MRKNICGFLVALGLTSAGLGQTITPPLSFDNAIFNSVVTSGAVTLSNGQTISNKSITADGQLASIFCNGSCSINTVRINSREGIRVAGSSVVNIDRAWIEIEGVPGDHADGLQAYSPGSRGTINVTNTTFRSHEADVNTGFFIADNYTGNINFQNVIVYGGPYGIKIHPDVGGDNIISFKDVYFVGPFSYGPMLFTNVGGHVNKFVKWENVRYATIVDGKLVPGNLIPCPDAKNCTSSTTPTLAAPKNLRTVSGTTK